MRRSLVSVLGCALLLSACREGAEPYTIDPVEWPADGTALRLTYNAEDDRAPAWSADGDSIYYVARGFPPFPLADGLLLRTAGGGGLAAPLLASLQLNVSQRPLLAGPAVAPDGERIALVELHAFEPYECEAIVCPTVNAAEDTVYANPQLKRAVIRIRSLTSTTPADDFQHPVSFAGITHDSTRHPFDLQFVTIHDVHPFHRLYNRDRAQFFRPAWSPDGQQLAYSDGLNIYIWRLGATIATTLLPNSQDGVWPAWSPDGTSIAFTRLTRGAAKRVDCTCNGTKGVGALYEKTVYAEPANHNGTLVVMRPDGSGLRELGAGDAPAWLPDSKTLIAARGGRLVAIDAESGAAQAIAGTENGFEPAVSGDGNSLAFSRATSRPAAGFPDRLENVYDVWVVRLPE